MILASELSIYHGLYPKSKKYLGEIWKLDYAT